MSSPLLAVEETKSSKNDEQHEPHRGDGEKDVQPPGVFLLWWPGDIRGSKMEKSETKKKTVIIVKRW